MWSLVGSLLMLKLTIYLLKSTEYGLLLFPQCANVNSCKPRTTTKKNPKLIVYKYSRKISCTSFTLKKSKVQISCAAGYIAILHNAQSRNLNSTNTIFFYLCVRYMRMWVFVGLRYLTLDIRFFLSCIAFLERFLRNHTVFVLCTHTPIQILLYTYLYFANSLRHNRSAKNCLEWWQILQYNRVIVRST